MNVVVLMGRLTKDPDVRYSQGQQPMAVARYTLAVDRPVKKDGQNADFIGCVAFGKNGEFAEKYLAKGVKVALSGHIQTGSYKDKDGKTVYTTDVIVDRQEFAESRAASEQYRTQESPQQAPPQQAQESLVGDGFMDIPAGLDEAGLPWN